MTDSNENKSGSCLLDIKLNNKEDVGCPWYINSKKHNNCFWVYVKDKSSVDGSMHEHVQSEIASLLGWSNTKTHFMLKQAMSELIEALKKHEANQLLDSESIHYSDFLSYGLEPIRSTEEE